MKDLLSLKLVENNATPMRSLFEDNCFLKQGANRGVRKHTTSFSFGE